MAAEQDGDQEKWTPRSIALFLGNAEQVGKQDLLMAQDLDNPQPRVLQSFPVFLPHFIRATESSDCTKNCARFHRSALTGAALRETSTKRPAQPSPKCPESIGTFRVSGAAPYGIENPK